MLGLRRVCRGGSQGCVFMSASAVLPRWVSEVRVRLGSGIVSLSRF